MKSPSAKTQTRVAWLLAGLVALAYALGLGVNYGISNQSHYLLAGLKIANPDLLKADWLTTHTTTYHVVFAYISAVLYKLPNPPMAFGILNVVAVTAFGLSAYGFLTGLFDRWSSLIAFVLLAGFWTVTGTNAAGGANLVQGYIQPSTFGTIGCVAAAAFFVRKRWWMSGLCLALGGAMHANYLILSGPLFFLAHLIYSRRGVVGRWLAQLTLPTLVLLLVMPLLLSATGQEHTAAGQDIKFNIRAPHHYLPSSFEKGYSSLMGWTLATLGLGHSRLFQKRNATLAGSLLGGTFLVVWLGTLLSTTWFHALVSEMFPMRLGPFTEFLLQGLFFGQLASMATTVGRRDPIVSGWGMVASLGGLTYLMMLASNRRRWDFVWIEGLAFVVIVFSGFLAGPILERATGKFRRVAMGGLGFVLGLTMLVFGVAKFVGPHAMKVASRGRNLKPNANTTAFHWIRDNTPKDAVFATPPLVEGFQLFARRANVAEWKVFPHIPDETIEWYSRIEALTGRQKFRSRRGLGAGYSAMDPKRLALLKSRYHISYALFRGCPARLGKHTSVVYRDRKYCVVKVP